MIKLYGAPLSPYVRKCVIALNLKNLAFEHINIMPFQKNDDPDFDHLSPFQKIPAFKDEQIGLSDSTVICEYLEDAYTSGLSLYSNNIQEKAHIRWFEEFGDSVLGGEVGPKLFFQKVVKKLSGQEPDEAAINFALNKGIPKMVDYIEQQLSESNSDFLVGSNISIGDVSVYCQMINAIHVDFNLDAKQWPKTAAYIEMLKAHPAIAPTYQVDIKVLTHLGII